MHDIPLCRSLTYYVDSSSTSSTELGTQNHPYKNYEPVNIELMNFHTGNDRSVMVYVREETINYMLQAKTFVSSITSFAITTYSTIRGDPEKANFVGAEVEKFMILPGVPTLFNILGTAFLNNHIANTNILKNEKVNLNSELSSTEISDFDAQTAIFLNHRSAVFIDNFLLTTEYNEIITTDLFFAIIDVVPRQTNLTNLEIQVSGRILNTEYPNQLYIANTRVDYYKTRFGFYTRNKCPDDAVLDDLYFIADNVTFYNSQELVANLGQRHGISQRGYGNFYVRNSYFSVYSTAGQAMSSVRKADGSM
jgi:hypothetical protein